MLPKRLDQVKASDIQSLVENKVREGKMIEYKEQLPAPNDEGKKEFLADVSSFANASGGDLLFGISEERDAGKTTGIPQSADGISGMNTDQEIRRLESMIRDGIEPRIPGVQIQAVEGFPQGPLLVVRVPKSWASPHMVTFKASPRFFVRTSAGKSPLDVSEIRAAFLQSDALSERIRHFREKRLGEILADETPVRTVEGAKVVLHVIPITTFGQTQQVDLAMIDGPLSILLSFGGAGYGERRLNLDGFITYNFDATSNAGCNTYTQLFRDGAIEGVDTAVLSGHDEQKRFIPSLAFEEDVMRSVDSYLKLLSQLQVLPPFVVFLTLLNVRGFHLEAGSQFMRGRVHKIDRDHLLFPEVLIEDTVDPIQTALRPLFDILWQACGFPRSLNYDAAGKRGRR